MLYTIYTGHDGACIEYNASRLAAVKRLATRRACGGGEDLEIWTAEGTPRRICRRRWNARTADWGQWEDC